MRTIFILLSVLLLLGSAPNIYSQNKLSRKLSKNELNKLNPDLKLLSYKHKKQKSFLKSTKDKEEFNGYLNYNKKRLNASIKKDKIYLKVIVKCHTETQNDVVQLLQNYNTIEGKKYCFITGEIVIGNLNKLCKKEGVISIEPSYKLQSELDNSIVEINADDAWQPNGNSEIDASIDGSGVYVGIIELDEALISHETFNDSDGNSRVDKTYNYDIFSGAKDHATHVGGIAAGIGDSNKKYKGVAYNSRLLFAEVDDAESILTTYNEMINFAKDNPLVVNASLGQELGPHDGSTNFDQSLNTLINNSNSCFVAAAGNYGRFNNHKSGTINSNSLHELIFENSNPNTTVDEFTLEIWYNGDATLDVQLEFYGNQEGNDTISAWIGIDQKETWDYSGDGVAVISNTRNINNGENVITISFLDYFNNDVIIPSAFNNGFVKIKLNNTSSNTVNYHAFKESAFGVEFRGGDNNYTIASPGTAEQTITVANYGLNNSSFIYNSSSRGPIRSGGYLKPDIAAPGVNIISSISDGTFSDTNVEGWPMTGTSMSAPHVTGAIALLLQNFGNLTSYEIKTILRSSARTVPNMDPNDWGAGKLDILAAYEYMVGYIDGLIKQEYRIAYDSHNDSENLLQYNNIKGLPIEEPHSFNGLQVQEMTNGALVLVSNSPMAFWLSEKVWDKWLELGDVTSNLGNPTSTEFLDEYLRPRVDFENGYIIILNNEAIVEQNPTEPSSLSNGIISPILPNENLPVVFSVNYSDPSNQPPQVGINLHVNGTIYTMVKSASNDFENGVEYTYTHPGLSEGEYAYHFETTSSSGTPVRWPESGEQTFTVHPSSEGWDISIDQNNTNLGSSNIDPGDDITVQVGARNGGIYTYTSVPVNIDLINPLGHVISTSSGQTGAIAPSNVYSLDVGLSIPSNLDDGTYSVVISLNPDKDEDFSNNSHTLTFYIGPDLPNEQFRCDDGSELYEHGDDIVITNQYGQSVSFNIYGTNSSQQYIGVIDPTGDRETLYKDQIEIFGSLDRCLILDNVANIGTVYATVYGGYAITSGGANFTRKNIAVHAGQSAEFYASAPSGLRFDDDSDDHVSYTSSSTNLVKDWYSSITSDDSYYSATFTYNIPSNTPPGTYRFYLLTNYRSVSRDDITRLEITVLSPLPQITELNSNNISADDEITISGENFGSSGSVYFGGIESSSASVWTNSSITCVVPEGISNGNIMVVNSSGTSNAIPYTVKSSTGAPELVSSIPDQTIHPNETRTICSLHDIFSDPNNDELTFSFTFSDNNVSGEIVDGNFDVSANNFILNPIEVTLTAIDENEKSVNESFVLNVPDRLFITPTNQSIGFEGGDLIFDVYSNVMWNVSEDEEWLGTSINENQLSVHVNQNATQTSQDGIITLSGEGIAEVYCYIHQDASPLPKRIHVSTTGSNETGDGTELNPYSTIQHAIDQAYNNDTVYVHNGEYFGVITMKSNLYLKGESNTETIIRGNSGRYMSGQGSYDAVVFNNVFEATIDGFLIENQSDDMKNYYPFTGIAVKGDSDHSVLIKNCIFQNLRYGVNINPPAKPSVINNTFNGYPIYEASGDYGIYIDYNTTNVVIKNNIIVGYLTGVYAFGAGTIELPTMEYNNLWDNTHNYYMKLEDYANNYGNISQNPLFTDVPNKNFALQLGSPCINTGDPSLGMDANGNRLEMGAVPYMGEEPYVNIITLNYNIGEGSGTIAIPIESNISWSAITENGWISLVKTDETTLTVNYELNSSTESRQAIISVSGNGVQSQGITIVQAEGVERHIQVAPTSHTFQAGVETKDLTITSNTDWNIWYMQGNWFTISQTEGTGDATVTVTSTMNTGGDAESTQLLVFGEGISEPVSVDLYQRTPPLFVSPGEQEIEYESGSSGGISITTDDVNWYAYTNADWLDLSSASGLGSATIEVTSNSENTTGNDRTAIVNVSVAGMPIKFVRVTQKAYVPEETHFQPNWEGGLDHMNIYVLTAQLDGFDLQSGDEIGIFDGDECVGYGKLSEVLTGANYLECKTSLDDPTTTAVDGFTTGNAISYRIWKADTETEYSNITATYDLGSGVFSSNGSATVHLNAVSSITQTIALNANWNILSYAAMPDDISMQSIVAPMIGDDVLIKMQDERGNAIENLGVPIGWIYNIGDMANSEGYKIKVNTAYTHQLTGAPVELPYTINLAQNWNIMGYPLMQSQSASAVFQPLIDVGVLIKVQDERGNAMEDLGIPIGWIDNIINLEPGEGYKVKVTEESSVVLTDFVSKSAVQSSFNRKPVHFMTSYVGYGLDHMNIYLSKPTAGGILLQQGDEVAVFDGGICVGVGVVDKNGQALLGINTSYDDPTTNHQDGFIEGNPFTLKMWNKETREESGVQNIEIVNGFKQKFERFETTMLHVDFYAVSKTYLGDAYPNPSELQTYIPFSLSEDTRVTLEILDITGRKVKTLFHGSLTKGEHELVWENDGEDGSIVGAGMYIYKLTCSSGVVQAKRLVVKMNK